MVVKQHDHVAAEAFERACRSSEVDEFMKAVAMIDGPGGWEAVLKRAAALAIAAPAPIREAALAAWTKAGRPVFRTPHDRSRLIRALRALLPDRPYRGLAFTALRGATAIECRRSACGLHWTTDRATARRGAGRHLPQSAKTICRS